MTERLEDVVAELVVEPPALTCERAEAMIAARLAQPLAAALEEALVAHLDDCAGCAELAAEAAGPVVADLLLEIGGVAEPDLPGLEPVARALYVRGHEVGRGGMGRIVRARDRRLGRAVVIKELLDDRLRARFEREARLTARLQHPGVVNVLEAGRWEDGSPFYAMKYVAGRPLSEAIAERRTLAARLGLLPHLIAAVDAIAYAHSEGIVHRDLKPHNILLGPFGETVVVDWGLAKDLGELGEPVDAFGELGGALTRAGAGTPGYMPPEQARGDAPDERVDVYALGVTLAHLLAGHLVDGPLVVPGAPVELTAIVAKATAPERHDRYASATELAEELKRFQTGQLVRAHAYTLGQRLARWLRRHRLPMILGGLTLATLAVTGTLALGRVLEARREAIVGRDRSRWAQGELLVELARQDLLAGAITDAASKLGEARRLGVDGEAVRFLAAEAERRTWRLVRYLPGAALRFPERVIGFADADRALVVGGAGTVWDLKPRKPGNGEDMEPPRRLRIGRWELPVRWSQDGAWLAIIDGAPERQVRILTRTGELTGTLLLDADPALVEFAGDSARLMTVAGSTAALWDTSGRALSTSRLPGTAHGAALNSTGDLLAVAGTDGTRVYRPLWDVPGTYLGDRGVVASAFSSDGELAILDGDGAIAIYDGQRKLRLRAAAPARAIAIAWAGPEVVAASADGRVWSVSREGLEHSWPPERVFATRRGLFLTAGGRLAHAAPRPVAVVVPGLDLVAVHHVDRSGQRAIVETRELLWRVELSTGRTTPLVPRGGRDVLVADEGGWMALSAPGHTDLWDLAAARLVARAPQPVARPAAFVGRRGALLVSAPPGPPERWSIDGKGSVVREVLPGTPESRPVFRDDGALFADVTSAGRLRLFAGQRALAEFPAMRPIAFSPDGQQLLVLAGAQVRLLDVSE